MSTLSRPLADSPARARPFVRATPLGTLAALGIGTALGMVGCASADPGRSGAAGAPADAVVAWNGRILGIAEAEDGFLTLKGVRVAAMAHLAMHDALAAIQPRFEPFLPPEDRDYQAAAAADGVVAANEAAFAVAVAQYPDREADLAAERDRWRGVALAPAALEASRAVGRRAAARILAAREGDDWDADPEYTWRPMGPGVYAEFPEHSGTPDGFVFGAGWAVARPFVMGDPARFRSPPPPAIASEAYARAFKEVKEVGSRRSATRTPEQTHLAMWWKEFVEKSHNRLARELALADGLALREAARLFALLNMSIFDAYVASFDAKFHYNHWRPYTAIRRADRDGNPATARDPDWTNLHDHTYAFPSYPSAHGSACGAAMTVMAHVFGHDRPFVMTIREVDAAGPMSPKVPAEPPTRSFDRFAVAADECGLSRVYLGIHFRYDSVEGVRMGRKVGELAIREFLTPVDEDGG